MPEHETGNIYRWHITREEAKRLEASNYCEPLIEANNVRFYVETHPQFEAFTTLAMVRLRAEHVGEQNRP